NKKKLSQLNKKSSQYLQHNNITIDYLIKRPKIYNFFDSMMLDDKIWLQKNNIRIENRVKSGEIFSSDGKKMFDSSKRVSISKQLQIYYNEYKHCIKKLNTDIILNENIFLMKFINDILSYVERYCEKSNVQHISNFNKLINKIIVNQPSAFIYEKTGRRYKNFLIDEFQDTSILQWQNLLPLIVDSIDYNKSLIVGDAKQSIYRWRSSEVNQFIDLPKLADMELISTSHEWENKLKSQYEMIFLENNFRSKKNIIKFNNDFFEKIKQNCGFEIVENIYQNLHQKDSFAEAGGYVNIELLDNDDFDNAICNKISSEIFDLVSKNLSSYKDIAILCNSNKDIQRIANHLVSKNIPIISDEGLLLARCKQVKFIINFIKNIQLSESFTRFLVLNYLFGDELNKHDLKALSISAERFEKRIISTYPNYDKKQFLRYSIYEIVEKIVLNFNLKNDAYVHHFKNFALNYQNKYSSNLESFIKFWEENNHKEKIQSPSDINAVNLLTIHKSKGLSFKNVIIPFNWDRNLNRKFIYANDFIYKSEILSLILNYSSILKDSLFSEIYEKEREMNFMDNINKLYVAMTRAVDRLYIYSKNPSKSQLENKFEHLQKGYLNSFLCVQEFKYPFVFGGKDFTSTGKKTSNLSIKISTNNKFKNWKDLLKFKFTENDKKIIYKKDWGTVFHLALSRISSIDLISKVINDLLVQGLCNKPESIKLEKQINEFLSHDEIRSYFFNAFEVINEKEILLRDGRSFIPDKVIIKDNEVLIIDFKTGVEKDDHLKKIQEYSDIYSLLGYRNIKTKLIYVKNYISDEQ
ncbi:UvrD-helicase domain-containing protein, partial [Bacteroidota bacterium]|nr:UvrD-helicase domain-containing protein [Bacteroidota bacterium]